MTTPYERMLEIEGLVERDTLDEIEKLFAGIKPYDKMKLYDELGDESPDDSVLKALNDAAKMTMDSNGAGMWKNFDEATASYKFIYRNRHKQALQDLYRDYLDRYGRRRTYDIYATEIGKNSETIQGLRDKITEIPRDERPLFLALLRKNVKQQERSFGQGLKESFWRGVGSMYENIQDVPVVFGLSDGDDMAWYRQARAVAAGSDSVEATQGGILGLAEQGAYGAAQMVPNLLGSTAATMAGGQPAGVAWWFAQIAPDRYAEYRAQGISDGYARLAAIASALPEAAVEMVQFKQLTPFLRHGAQQTAAAAVRPTLRRFLTSTASTYGKEVGEEGLQGAINLAVKAMASFLDKNAPGVDWGAEASNIGNEVLQAALTMPYLMVPGTIHTGMTDIRLAKEFDMLKALDVDLVQRIATIETPEGKRGPSRKAFMDLGLPIESEGKRADIVTAAKELVAGEEARRAEGVGAEVETPGRKEELVGREEGRIRVRDVEEDRLEAKPPEEAAIQPSPRVETPREGVAREAPEELPPNMPREPIRDAPEGNPAEIFVSGTKGPTATRFAAIDLAQLVASDDFSQKAPVSNVEKGLYPARWQTRQYDVQSAEAAKVERLAEEMRTAYWFSTDPTPTSGPPIVLRSGVVIQGNARTMALQAAVRGGNYEQYKQAFVAQAAQFGLDPNEISKMDKPVLVRMLDLEAENPEVDRLARSGNIPTTMTQSVTGQAEMLKDIVDEGVIDSIVLEGDETFSEAVGKPEAPDRTAALQKEAEDTREAILQATEERPQAEFRHAGLGVAPSYAPLRPNIVPAAIQAATPEIERRIQATTGLKETPGIDLLKEFAKKVWAVTTRPYEFISRKKFPVANEVFRLLKAAEGANIDQTVREVAAILDPMGPQQFQVFQRYIYLHNHLASARLGQGLRDGYKTPEQLEGDMKRVDLIAEQVPEVMEAIRARKAMVNALVKDAVKHEVLPPDAMKHAETYFHQQVLSKMRADDLLHRPRFRKMKRGFQKRRTRFAEKGVAQVPEEYDYNKDYIQSELTWMIECRNSISEDKARRQLETSHDIAPQLRTRAKGLRESGENPNVRWQDLVPEGHEIFQYQAGNRLYKAFTIPERLTEELERLAMEQLQATPSVEVTPDVIREVLAIGGPHKQYVFPKELCQQLRKFDKPKAPPFIDKLSRELLNAWKRYTLLNPKRALAYNLRNLTGDLDPVIAAAPGILKGAWASYRALINYHKGLPAIEPDLADARDLAVVDSGITDVEMPRAREQMLFKRFYGSKASAIDLLGKPFSAYWDFVREKTSHRENVLRYAAYRYYLKKLQKGESFHYGGANKDVADTLAADMGNDVAAAHLSRNLLGDYGDLTVLGEWLRSHVAPFWSWQEINFKRWPTLFINSYQQAKMQGWKNKVAAPVYFALTMGRLAWLFGGLWLFNNLLFPDEEDDLGIYERSMPHLTLGRTSTGNVRVLRNTGALGDMFEWFGINNLLALYPKYRDGQITGADLVADMAKSPVNKFAQSVRPEAKSWEILTGQSYFPDVFHPRQVPSGEAVANVFGLVDEFRGAKGMLLGDGNRFREDYFDRFLGVVNPRQSALYEIYQLRDDYLKKEGRERPPFFGTPASVNLRRAAMLDNYNAFKDARRTYLATGKTVKNFQAFIRALDPISQRLSDADEQNFQNRFLNSLQRAKLKVARDYAQELRVRLWAWWVRAHEEEKESKKF